MTSAADLAAVACLLGDESRAAMCLAMLDGSSWTVSELAAEAGIGRAAASEHVRRLVDGGLVTTQRQGRNTYVRLTGPRVAEVLERLAAFGEPAPPRSLSAVPAISSGLIRAKASIIGPKKIAITPAKGTGRAIAIHGTRVGGGCSGGAGRAMDTGTGAARSRGRLLTVRVPSPREVTAAGTPPTGRRTNAVSPSRTVAPTTSGWGSEPTRLWSR